jgi:hypothetical protein
VGSIQDISTAHKTCLLSAIWRFEMKQGLCSSAAVSLGRSTQCSRVERKLLVQVTCPSCSESQELGPERPLDLIQAVHLPAATAVPGISNGCAGGTKRLPPAQQQHCFVNRMACSGGAGDWVLLTRTGMFKVILYCITLH